MPSPEVSYCVEGACQLVKIGGDVCHYIMGHPDADRIYDAFDLGRPSDAVDGNWNNSLNAQARYLENVFTDWRKQASSEQRRGSSIHGLLTLREQFEELSLTCVRQLAFQAEELSKTQAGIDAAVARYQLEHGLGVLERVLERSQEDLDCFSTDEMQHILRTEVEAERARALDFQRAHQHYTYDGQTITFHKGPKPKKTHRNPLKRSIKLLTSIIGAEPTRVFINREAIRFEGSLAVYQLTLTGGLHVQHGGATLDIYGKDDPEQKLCRLCIYTPGVPVCDHVASIVMHIRSGQEEDILTIGNAFDVSEAAYQREWLVPYLPKRYVKGEGKAYIECDLDRHFLIPREPEPTAERMQAAKEAIYGFLRDRFQAYVPFLARTTALEYPGDYQDHVPRLPSFAV